MTRACLPPSYAGRNEPSSSGSDSSSSESDSALDTDSEVDALDAATLLRGVEVDHLGK